MVQLSSLPPVLQNTPPPEFDATFPTMRQLRSVPALLQYTPPAAFARLPRMMHLSRKSPVPTQYTPPPLFALLPQIVQSCTSPPKLHWTAPPAPVPALPFVSVRSRITWFVSVRRKHLCAPHPSTKVRSRPSPWMARAPALGKTICEERWYVPVATRTKLPVSAISVAALMFVAAFSQVSNGDTCEPVVDT